MKIPEKCNSCVFNNENTCEFYSKVISLKREPKHFKEIFNSDFYEFKYDGFKNNCDEYIKKKKFNLLIPIAYFISISIIVIFIFKLYFDINGEMFWWSILFSCIYSMVLTSLITLRKIIDAEGTNESYLRVRNKKVKAFIIQILFKTLK